MIPKIIILEGVDKTGKSTLAKQISESTGYPMVHLGVPPDGLDYQGHLIKLVKQHPDGVVFDRFHWGDYVYNGLAGADRKMDWAQFDELEQLLLNLGAVVIYCHATGSELKRRFTSEKEELISTGVIPILQYRYGQTLHRTKLPVFRHWFPHNEFQLTQLNDNQE